MRPEAARRRRRTRRRARGRCRRTLCLRDGTPGFLPRRDERHRAGGHESQRDRKPPPPRDHLPEGLSGVMSPTEEQAQHADDVNAIIEVALEPDPVGERDQERQEHAPDQPGAMLSKRRLVRTGRRLPSRPRPHGKGGLSGGPDGWSLLHVVGVVSRRIALGGPCCLLGLSACGPRSKSGAATRAQSRPLHQAPRPRSHARRCGDASNVGSTATGTAPVPSAAPAEQNPPDDHAIPRWPVHHLC
jgi:hypothetical protein